MKRRLVALVLFVSALTSGMAHADNWNPGEPKPLVSTPDTWFAEYAGLSTRDTWFAEFTGFFSDFWTYLLY